MFCDTIRSVTGDGAATEVVETATLVVDTNVVVELEVVDEVAIDVVTGVALVDVAIDVAVVVALADVAGAAVTPPGSDSDEHAASTAIITIDQPIDRHCLIIALRRSG
jgi:hypothetical protein